MTSACAPLVGGAVLIGLVGVGVLSSRCYDYLDVTVLDPDGRKTCAATVTATNGGNRFELDSCYYAALTDGHWTLRASLPGVPDALSTVEVDHEHDCARNVQTVELTLNRTVGKSALPPPPASALPPPATRPPSVIPTTPPPPAAIPSAAGSPAPSALPADSAAPSVGVFPDH
ncbi:MAG: hypothetical protein WDO69_16890 [Pseudomonadota bacterium]